jgi:hypothetical protein
MLLHETNARLFVEFLIGVSMLDLPQTGSCGGRKKKHFFCFPTHHSSFITITAPSHLRPRGRRKKTFSVVSVFSPSTLRLPRPPPVKGEEERGLKNFVPNSSFIVHRSSLKRPPPELVGKDRLNGMSLPHHTIEKSEFSTLITSYAFCVYSDNYCNTYVGRYAFTTF